MSDLERLLDVQAHDTRVDQLRHRQATLPERQRISDLAAQLARLAGESAETAQRRDELARQQRRLEDELAAISEKRRSVDKAMYGGAVSNPRELQAMQDEVASLRRRQSQLEDQILELMEGIEPLGVRLTELDAAAAGTRSETDTATTGLAAAEAEIAGELEQEAAARAEALAGVPEELVTEYEGLRVRAGGIGVARLLGNQCGGCHLTLSAVGLARIKKLPPDAVAHCEECGRLLVH